MRAKDRIQPISAKTLLWALLISLLPVGLLTAPLAQAVPLVALSDTDALVFNRANGFTNFVGTGLNPGDKVLYKSVGNFSGVSIDCLITTVAVVGSISNYDAEGSATTLPAATYKNNFMINTTGGEARMRFEFFKAGTYTGENTGLPVVLQNVKVTSIDLDSSGTNAYQYSDFSGFQKYSMMDPTNLAVQPITGNGAGDPNRTRFIATKAGARSSAPEDQVLIKYDAMSSMEVRFGNIVAGSGNYFGLVFGGWPGTGTPVENSNSFNAPPISSDTSKYVVDTSTASAFTTIPTSAFGNYSDPDNNPFMQVKITAVSAGTLVLNGTNVSPTQVISIADIESGLLKYNPAGSAASNTVTFFVQDGLDYSVASYTLTLNKAEKSQIITFANPGTKAPSLTFASGATSTSGLPVVLTSNTPGVCTINPDGVTIVTVSSGICNITATQAGNSTYGAAAPVTQEFAVTSKTPQVITFANPGTKSVSTTPFNSGAVTNAALYVTLTSADTTICTVTNSSSAQPKITALKAGFCTVVATQAGTATIDPAVQVSVTFEITSPTAISTTSPYVYTTGAETITTNSAYLTGVLTANGSNLDYKFCWSSKSNTNTSTGALNYSKSGNSRVKCSSSFTHLSSTDPYFKVSENISSYISSSSNSASLSKDTTYYFQVVGTTDSATSSATIYGKVFQFRTKNDGSNSYLLAKTNPASGVTTSQANLNGVVEAKEATTSLSFCVSTTYQVASMQYLSTCDMVPFSRIVSSSVAILGSETSTASMASGLTSDTFYFYQIKAYSSVLKRTTYGNIVVFKTPAAPPVVTTLPVTTFESTTAVLPGTVLANGDSTTVTFQLCSSSVSTSCADSSPVLAATPGEVSGHASKSVSYSATGLNFGQRYYYRAKGVRGTDIVYGAVKSFVVGAPTVVTLAPTNLSIASPWNATLNGFFKPNSSTADLYFCIDSSTAVNADGFMTACDTGGGVNLTPANIDSSTVNIMDSATVTSLLANTIYYYQAVAKNHSNTALVSYGNIQSFTTANVPISITETPTSVTSTSATLNGTVTSNGAQTKVDFCFSTSNDRSPDFGDQLLSCDVAPLASTSPLAYNASSATVAYDISSLTKSTTYYYQVFAENAMGSALGSVKTFQTNAGGPTSTTRPASSLNNPTNGATLNGAIDANGSLTTAYFCWGRSSATVSVSGGDSMTACATTPFAGFTILSTESSTVSQSQAITGLTSGTNYFYQIYAINALGESSYGAVLSFNLSNPIVVTNPSATSITSTSAAIHGSVNKQTNSNVAGRFCIGLLPDLDANGLLADCVQSSDTTTEVSISSPGAVTMDYSLAGLDSGQTYFFQAYSVDTQATPSDPKPPTALGSVYSFNTLAIVTFNANGGTGTVDSQTAGVNTALKSLASLGFTNGSLAFNGWNTQADGTGDSYSNSFIYDFQNSIDLFAQWVTLTTYTVTYANGGGTGTLPTESAKASGANFTAASGSGLSRSGYTFGGWSCNGVTYGAGASITMTSAALVCTAIWNAVNDPDPTPTPVEPKKETPAPTPVEPKKETPAPVTPVVPTAPATQPDAKFEVAPATAITVQSGGKNEVVTIRPNEEKTGIIVSGSDWTLGIRSTTQQVQGSTSDSSARVVIEKGNTVTTHGTGFKPYTQVDVWVYSTAIWLGATMTDANGEFETTVPMPAALSEGNHTFQAKGVTPDNKDRSAAIPITLVPAVATVKKGSLRFEVFFGLNSVAITAAEKKHIAAEVAKIKKSISGTSKVTVTVEGWVQPSGPASNVKYLSTFRAKHVAQELKNLKLKGSYKLVYQGLERDNIPSARHASVIVTWIK